MPKDLKGFFPSIDSEPASRLGDITFEPFEVLSEQPDFSYKIIDFNLLTQLTKEVLLETLFKIYALNLKGRDFLKFKEQFFDSKADSIEIFMLKHKLDGILGYILFRRYDIEFASNKERQEGNKYAVFKVQVSFSKKIQGRNHLEYCLLRFFSNYHKIKPNVNLVLFDSALNPVAYKTAHLTSVYTFPSPIHMGNEKVDGFIELLRNYFGYELMNDANKYVVRSASTLMDGFSFQQRKEDPLVKFYCAQTQMKPHAGLIAIYCFHLVEDNSLNLSVRSKWSPRTNGPGFFKSLKEEVVDDALRGADRGLRISPIRSKL